MRARIIASLTMLFTLASQSLASADVSGRHTSSGNGIVISNDVYAAAGGGGSSAYDYLVERYEACEGAHPDIGCDPFASSCPGYPTDDPENQWRLAAVYQRPVGTAGPWDYVASQCLNFSLIAPQVTPEMAYEQMVQLLPVLDFSYLPDVEGLVNLPVIVYTDPTQVWTFPPVILLDQAVVIRSTAITYTWSFGGVEMAADWPGRPYAYDCERIPCAGYVSFPFPAPGQFQIGLTVTWTGEFSVNGGAWQPVSDVGTTVSPPRAVTILEAHAVLTDPYD